MKRKLLFAALCVVSALGQLRAQTDVTSTYITNPSFEADGSKTASNGALTMTGWIQSDPTNQFNNTGFYDSSANPPTQGTITVTPSNGDYYLFFRKGWAQATYTFTTSEAKELPAGFYSLSVDYKMVEGYDDKENNKTKVTISAKNGDTVLGTATGTTKTNVKGGSNYTYLNSAEWSTVTANFKLDAATSTNFVIGLEAGGQRRSDFVVDNVRLTYWPMPSSPWGAGEFYLKNVKENQYLAPGRSWGTHAIVSDVPSPFTIGVEAAGYTFESRVSNGGSNYYLNGLYCDGAKVAWIVKEVSTGVYALTQDGTNYLASNGAGAEVNTVTDNTNAAAQWTLVSKSDYLATFAAATKANPVSATGLIKDQNFGRNNRDFSSWTVTSGGGEAKKAGAEDNMNWQQWNSTFDINQTVSDLPAGLYSMKVQGFYRPGANNTSSTDQNSYIYAGDETPVAIQLVSSNGAASADASTGRDTENTNTGSSVFVPNSQGSASKAFSAGLYDSNELSNILVTDGTLKIGAKCETNVGNAWTVIDNFRLFYYGPTISTTAVALPDGGAMTADTWYYFDIASDATYDLALTTLSDIVYTKETKVLVEDAATVNDHFAQVDELALTAGRYYVKSATDQSLVVTAHAKVYEVGEATVSLADNAYLQSISTVTFTYASANTNDGEASLAIVDGEAVATLTDNATSAVMNGTLSSSGNVLTATFSGDLTVGHTYTLALPANVFGYAGQALNAAISQTVNTPAIFDGIFFLRTSDGKYASRGGNYNTRAMIDEFGLPMHLQTNAEGKSEFIMVDSYFHLFDAGSGNVYTDNNSNPYWEIAAVSGGYTIKNINDNGSNGKYLGIQDNHLQSVDDSYVWTLEPASEHKTNVEPLKDAQAAAAATAAGITATTKAELATEVAANYNAVPVTITGVNSFQEEYQVGAGSEYAGNGHTTFTETVEGLTPGLYKLTVKAFHRMTWNPDVESASGVSSNVYVFAGNVKTQICSVFDAPAATPWVSGNDYQDANGKFYPNNPTGAGAAFDAGNYENEVWVYVTGTSLTFGIFNPNRLGNDGSRGAWLTYRDFTLTRYQNKNITIAETATEAPEEGTGMNVTLTRTLKGGQWNGFSVPFDFTIAGSALEGAEVKEFASVIDNEIALQDATAIVAGNPYLVKPENDVVNPTFEGVTVTAATDVVKGEGDYTFQAHLYATDLATNGSVAYMSTTDSKIKKLTSGSIKGLRAIFNIPKSSNAKALVVRFDNTPTGILAVDAEGNVYEGAIYNLAGQKLNAPVKGINIIGGKKVVVK